MPQANKALREEAKLKEFALDAKFRKEWETILDKQERERTDRLNANHVKQTLQVGKGERRGTAGKGGGLERTSKDGALNPSKWMLHWRDPHTDPSFYNP